VAMNFQLEGSFRGLFKILSGNIPLKTKEVHEIFFSIGQIRFDILIYDLPTTEQS
jgi:hypothetical protein